MNQPLRMDVPSPPRGAFVRAFDSLVNLVSGLGTAKDKSTWSQYTYAPLNPQQLEAAYRTDWVARKIIRIPAYDSTREWRQWHADDDQIKEIENCEKTLQIKRKTRQVIEKARLWGGAALVLGVDVGKPWDELDPEDVGEGDLKWVHVVSRFQLTAWGSGTNWDITSPWYGEPEFYRFNQRGNVNPKVVQETERIHPSRIIRFVGNEVPDLFTASEPWWGDSVLQSVDDAVRSAGMVTAGIAAMIQEAKVDIFKIPEFSEIASTPQGATDLANRLTLANQMKSIINAMVIDKEEDWDHRELNLSGMPHIIQEYMAIAAGAADIPATRMLGQAPKGMNATGESDTRNYYDRLSSEQSTEITPALAPLDEILLRSIFGERDDSIYYEWRPLWLESDETKAKNAFQKAQATKIYSDSGLVPEAVLSEVVVNQLIEDGFYPGLDAAMENFDYEKAFGDPEEPAPEPVPPQLGKAPGVPQLPAPAKPALPKPQDGFADALTERWHGFMRDLAPRPLYVWRKVLNSEAIRAWAKSQGFTTMLPEDDLHTTILYSHTPVDWMELGDWYPSNSDGTLRIPPGGPRAMERFGPNGAVVLAYACSELKYRNQSMRDKGASATFSEYQPHITITYHPPDGLDLSKVEPYQGEIILGPEVFEEIIGEGFDPGSTDESEL